MKRLRQKAESRKGKRLAIYRKAFLTTPRGLEVSCNSQGNTAIPRPGGAESGALDLTRDNIDPGLAALIDAWPALPEPIRAGILAMVRASGA